MSAKILVIDDETDFIELIQYHLQKAGFEVLAAETGRTGSPSSGVMRRISSCSIWGCLMSMAFRFVEILRRDSATARIPIVLVTAMSGEIPRVHALGSGPTTSCRNPSLARLCATACKKRCVSATANSSLNRSRMATVSLTFPRNHSKHERN